MSPGDGVNEKQDRSAKRLVHELSRHISPSEAYHTVVIDETGEEYRLVKNLPSTTNDGLRLSWPEKLIGFGREGITLKFGAVRVPIGKFLKRCLLDPDERKRLDILTHPWLQGVVEIMVADPQVAHIQVPRFSAGDFSDFFYRSHVYAEQLAKTILQIVLAVALREMNKRVTDDLEDYCKDGELVLNGCTYKLSCADEANLWRVEHVALGGGYSSNGSRHEILINLTHPIFRTIDPGREEIMQVIWWQLAIWIAQNQPEMFEDLAHFNLRVNKIYLALREQNSERWDE